jgi:hypothetical protein
LVTGAAVPLATARKRPFAVRGSPGIRTDLPQNLAESSPRGSDALTFVTIVTKVHSGQTSGQMYPKVPPASRVSCLVDASAKFGESVQEPHARVGAPACLVRIRDTETLSVSYED